MRRAFVCLFVTALAGCGGGSTSSAVSGGDAKRGKELISDYGCGGCHVIGGVDRASGRVGPSLEDFRDKQFIAGTLPNKPDAVARWIVDPQKILPGVLMPDLGVNTGNARDIAAYLYTQ